jgi:hypothetical protein
VAKKRQQTENLNQFSFDFSFNQTVETIDRLQAAMDLNEDQGAHDVDRTTTTAGDSGQGTQPGDDAARPAFSLSSERMEDHRPLGLQQPGEAAGNGQAGLPIWTTTVWGATCR